MQSNKGVSIAILWWIVFVYNSGAFLLGLHMQDAAFPLYAAWVLGGNLLLAAVVVQRVWLYARISSLRRAVLLSAVLLPLFFFGLQLICGQFMPDPHLYLHLNKEVHLLVLQRPISAALACGAAALVLSHLAILLNIFIGKSKSPGKYPTDRV